MKLYLAGPMSGIKDFNYPLFHKIASRLRELGHHVENPAENPVPPCKTWKGYMRMAIRQLIDCEAVVLLPGWESSRGARVEYRLAHGLELQVIPLAAILED